MHGHNYTENIQKYEQVSTVCFSCHVFKTRNSIGSILFQICKIELLFEFFLLVSLFNGI